jgi:DNA-binding transcriptional MerR regulator
MYSTFVPRRVKIGDAAAFAGTTPRAIRHYHAIGLLPEPERGSDDRRRYGYDDMIRLLWIRRMADAGVALDDIRDAFADAPPAGDDGEREVTGILERLEASLLTQEAELQRQRAAVQRMRARGSRMGLLSDLVAGRLEELPEGSMRQADLDTLLVTERIFGAAGAAVQATRLIAVATLPGLRERSDRIDAAEEALDDTIAVDDPRVAEVAAERHAFETDLHAAIEASGLGEGDEALLDPWEALYPASPEGVADRAGRGAGHGAGVEQRSMSAFEAVSKMPYDFSPARLRCMELADELAAAELEAQQRS